MRPDMDKVIVERPRINSRAKSRKKGYRKYVASMSMDELPNREPMLGRWHGRDKYLNEHLGPMRRFLRSNVGRPWEKIHQELCEYISFDNAVQSHVLDHIFDFVHERVSEVSSSVVYGCWRWSNRQRRLNEGEMYICPASRILKVVKPCRIRRQPKQHIASSTVWYLRREQAWWEVRLCHMPVEPSEQWDVWLEQDVRHVLASEQFGPYGKKYFAVSKRLLGRVETQRLNKRIRGRTAGASRREVESYGF